MVSLPSWLFFFNDTATTEIYPLSLHDALPISPFMPPPATPAVFAVQALFAYLALADRKSTRLNSSHGYISYAVFCLKKNNDGDVVTCAARVVENEKGEAAVSGSHADHSSAHTS